MNLKKLGLTWGLLTMVCSFGLNGMAQDNGNTPVTSSSTAIVGSAVPGLINYTGVLKDANGKPLTSITGVTFLLYKDETGGAPVWIETQNVTPDKNGKYTVTLGATKNDGSLVDSFSNGQAHWLGVQVSSDQELPRVLLVAVPYALKASDADTIGGLPASAFVLANSNKNGSTGTASSKATTSSATKNSAPPANPAVTGKGVVDFIPMWDTTSDIVDSVIFQKSSQIGIGTTAPVALLDVNGKSDVRDTLTLFPKSTDNTLAVSGTSFKIDSTGKVTFISGQTFPGTGTITGVTTGSSSGLSGGGTSGTLALTIKSAGVTNTMLQNSKVTIPVTAPLTGGGAVSLGATGTTIALKPCAANQTYVSNGTAWSCAAAGTGTITGVTAGSGLSGGGTSGNVSLSVASAGITNAMLQHSSLTVTPGTGLTGGGSVALGAATTLNIDTTKIPELGSNNNFSGSQEFKGNVGIGTTASATAYTPLTMADSSTFGTWLALANTSSGGHTWNILSAGSANSEGVGNLGITDLTGTSTIWLEGNTNTGNLNSSGTVSAALGSFNGTNNSGPTVYANNAGAGDGLDVSTSSGVGMLAQSNSFDGAAAFANSTGGWGIFSEANGDANFETGVAGFEYGSTQENVGVWGYTASPHGIGVYDEGYSSSTEGTICCAGLYSIGMWADTSGTSSSNAGIAALTTVDTGYSIVSYSNSSYPTVWLENDVSTDSSAPVLITDGGSTGGVCIVDVGGNLTCSGSITPAVPVNNGAKKVALYGMEAAENWFEDAGAGQLTNGSAVIRLDQTFAETVNTNMDYHVFLTPNGDCKGLYVSQKSPTSFEVHELGGGTSSIAFDYRIMAKRRGYETARLEDRTVQFAGHAPSKRANGTRSASPDAVRTAHVKKDEDARKAVAMVKPVAIKTLKK